MLVTALLLVAAVGWAEGRLLELVAEHDVDLVVLARYMQILSDDL